MAVPKKRTSLSRKKMRRGPDALAKACVSACSNCGSFKRSHHVCPSCGHYRGRAVIVPSVTESDADV